jgi:hypothetical protein
MQQLPAETRKTEWSLKLWSHVKHLEDEWMRKGQGRGTVCRIVEGFVSAISY